MSVNIEKDDWAKNPTNGERGHTNIPNSRPPQPPNNYSSSSTSTSPHKRKRSDSEERQTSSATSYHSHSMPKSPQQRRLEHESGTNKGTEEAEVPLQRQSHYRPSSPNHDEDRPIRSKYPPLESESQAHSQSTKGWYSQEAQSASQPYSTQRPDSADVHLAETLQGESRMYEQQSQRGGGTDSPEDDDERGTPQRYGEYGTGNTPLSGVEAERKRRKRVFSNRTKTGCMTCRRRKKKCDEQHPECESTQRYLSVDYQLMCLKATTAFVVASSVKGIILGTHGKSHLAAKDPYLYSQRTAIPIHHQAINLRAASNRVIAARSILTSMRKTHDLFSSGTNHLKVERLDPSW